ncbi:hypothetical protein ACMFMG_006028 [Clarireedia jacksonii]
MPVSKYGVWKGHILSWEPPDEKSHAKILLSTPSTIITAAVNVFSPSSESELVYWLNRHYSQSQFLTQLSELNPGFHAGPGDQVPVLDLLQGSTIKLDEAIVAPRDETGESHGILDELANVVLNAITNRAIIYIFGSFDDGYLYNIHMNQGSSGRFQRENGVFQDGGILIEFSDGHWETIFIAFASQASATDDGGQPTGPLLRHCHKSQSHSENAKETDGEPNTDKQNTENTIDDSEIDAYVSESGEYAKDPTGIRDRTKACQGLFEDCQQYLVLSESDWIDHMSAKFNWWSLGIGAEKMGHSSLDHRVRNRDDVRNILVSLLDSLTTSLRNCIKIAQALQLDPKSVQHDVTEMKSKQKEAIPANTANSQLPDEDSELGEQVYYIRSTLEFLSRISAAIWKSGTNFRHRRADNLMEQRAAELKEFRLYLECIVLIGPQKIHLLNWILSRVTLTEPIWKKMWITLWAYFKDPRRLSPVQDRLIQANLIRRNRFDIYRRKLLGLTQTRGTNRNETAAHAMIETPMLPHQPDPFPGRNSSPKYTPQTQETFPKAATVDRSLLFSEPATRLTESFVTPQRPRKQDTRSVGTKVSQGVLKQDYPKCPVGEEIDFLCPCCAQPLDSSYSKNRRWRGHIAEDLSPYMCVYADCGSADAMYVTTDEWKQHLKDSHSAPSWICDPCWFGSDNPGQFEFKSEADWYDHTIAEHRGEFDESDLPALAEASCRTAIPPVACPLCYEDTRLLQPETDKHIAEHLHSFALQALPRESIGPDDDSQASVGSTARKSISLVDEEKTAEEVDWDKSYELESLIAITRNHCTVLSLKDEVVDKYTLAATLADLDRALLNLTRRYSEFRSDINDEIAACLVNLDSIFLRPNFNDNVPIDQISMDNLEADIAQGLLSLNELLELAESELNDAGQTQVFSTSLRPLNGAVALELASSVIVVIDLSAKVISWCSEYYTNVKNAQDDIKRIQGETQRLNEILEQVQSLCDGPNGAKLQASQNLRNGIIECERELTWLKTKLTPQKKQKLMSRYGIRALKWPFKSKEVDAIMKKLGTCKDTISFSLLVEQTGQILTIHQEIGLNKLKSANDAAFDSYAEGRNATCYQGTRVELLQQIDIWASDPSSKCIFWLNGMAGTGKSTISRTVAQNLFAKGELGASFFFKRGEGDRGHSGLLFATIATQLVQRLPSLAPYIQHAIEADPAISTKPQKQQFDELILKPISKLPLDPQKLRRIVIVVDALDECDSEEDIKIIIHLLSQVKNSTSVQLKFFLTSRPELPIRLGFADIYGKYEDLVLHQIPEAIIREDISVFLEYKFTMIRDEYNKSVSPIRKLPADWPDRSSLQSLVEMAVPLFFFATTICRFINDRKCGQPKEQLAKVLQYKTISQVSKLDAIYQPVLEQSLVGVSPQKKRDIIANFQQVVGSIIILAKPLSATSLDLLLGLPEGTAEIRVDLLHSVLSIPSNPNFPIRLLHLSFRDFLVAREKRETNPFWVDEKETHKKLASRCLLRLTTSGHLKKDICDLRVPERSRAEIDQKTIDTYLPPDIQYACQYWTYHLKKYGNIIYDNDQVSDFLKCYFLYWLEALSLIGRISESISMINDLIDMVDPKAGIKVSALLYDAKRFILTYLSIAESSPLQLYSAALVFSPKDSIIRNLYQNYIPNWISQQPNVESDWNAVLQTLEGHSGSVNSVAFSHDSKLLASASDDKTIKIWDTATGLLQQTLEGYRRSVNSVAFSHDSKLLASASDDKTIKIWDTATGLLQQTLEGHSRSVNSIAFSHDSKLLASASDDTTIKIWDTATGLLQQTLKGHSGSVNSVAFSHDSKQLASASDDKTIKIWDTATGLLQQTLKGHSWSVNSVAFSHDSKQLASASDDTTIKIWDTTTGLLQQTLEGYRRSVNSVAFSHDSKLLASASDDKTIKIWDTATGLLQQTLKGHSWSVNSVAFSHDSKQLASASDDKTIKIWDTAVTPSYITKIGYNRVERTELATLSDSSQEANSKNDREGLGINRHWVTWKTENLLWLPPEYLDIHPDISLSRSTIALRCRSGKELVIGFSLANLHSLT